MQTLELPGQSHDDVAFLNSTVGTGRSFEVRVNGQPFVLRNTSAARVEPNTIIELSVGSYPCWLSTGKLTGFTSLDELLGGTDLSALPQDLQPAVLEAAFEGALNQLEKATASIWNVQAVAATIPECVHRITLMLTNHDGHHWHGELAFGDELRATFRRLLDNGHLENVFPTEDIPIDAGVEIGSVQLSAAELSEIAPGDVIVMDVANDSIGRVRVCFDDRVVMGGIVQDENVVVESVTGVARCAEAMPANLSTLAVKLTFERGRCRLTSQALRELQAGDCIPFLRERDDSIIIRANSSVIGHGELVQLGIKTGVRMTDHVAAHR